jgi:hypothetical protein
MGVMRLQIRNWEETGNMEVGGYLEKKSIHGGREWEVFS